MLQPCYLLGYITQRCRHFHFRHWWIKVCDKGCPKNILIALKVVIKNLTQEPLVKCLIVAKWFYEYNWANKDDSSYISWIYSWIFIETIHDILWIFFLVWISFATLQDTINCYHTQKPIHFKVLKSIAWPIRNQDSAVSIVSEFKENSAHARN